MYLHYSVKDGNRSLNLQSGVFQQTLCQLCPIRLQVEVYQADDDLLLRQNFISHLRVLLQGHSTRGCCLVAITVVAGVDYIAYPHMLNLIYFYC